MIRTAFLACLLMLVTPVALATEAEETTTLTTAISESMTAANIRVSSYSCDNVTDKCDVNVRGWNATASTWTPGTQINFKVGELLSDGVTVGTLVSGPGLAKATPSGVKWLGPGECSAVRADLKTWCKSFSASDDPEARARKELSIQCLGGS